MKILKWVSLATIAGLLFVSSANAAVSYVTLNNVGDTADDFFTQTTTGVITDYIDLTIGNPFKLQAAFGGFTSGEFNQAGSTWALYQDIGNDLEATADTLIASGGMFDPQYQYVADIAAGNYYFKLVSDIAAIDGDEARTQYQLTLTQVPLPAAFWLFGSALIGFVGLGRRKLA